MQNPADQEEADRLVALRCYEILDTSPERGFDDLARLAAHVCSTPIAVITFIDEERQWFKSVVGLTVRESARSVAFCDHTIRSTEPFIVEDAAADDRFRDNPFVTQEPHMKFYAGVPLISPGGARLGALAVIDQTARRLEPEQLDLLSALARQVIDQLEDRCRLKLLQASKAEQAGVIAAWNRLIGNLPGTVYRCRFDELWTMHFLSNNVAALTGYPPEALLENRDLGFIDLIHPDDRERVKREVRAGLAQNGRFQVSYRILHRDGSERRVWGHGSRGEPTGSETEELEGYITDITNEAAAQERLALSEEHFRLIVRATHDAVWDWDLTSDRVWWNEGVQELFGHPADSIGESSAWWIEHIHAEDRERVEVSIREAIDGDAVTWREEYRFLCHDGSIARVADRGHLIRDTAGRAVRMVGGMSDQTKQKAIEEQYLRAQRMESIGALAGGIAHDLNNLLAPILMGGELLKREALSNRATRILAQIESSTLRGSDLVRQVLSFARGVEGERVLLKLHQLARELQAMVDNSFPKNIRFDTYLDKTLWPILGDATQLNQVLVNLAVNARDAMPKGGTLTLRAENVEIDRQMAATGIELVPGPFVRLEVSDTGVGMSPQTQARIFEPFFSTKPAGKGTGLGLSTVIGIVRAHRGDIRVESSPQRGTTFSLFFPAEPNEDEWVLQEEGTVSSAPCGRGELILLVDDESAVLSITRQTLETYGYRVLAAEDGAQAIGLFALHQESIDLVLTDLMMPVMDGPALIMAIRRLSEAVPIVAASGVNPGNEIDRAGALGVNAFLAKPFSASRMLACVDDNLAHRRSSGGDGTSSH